MARDLSVIIPARNEEFLSRTASDVLAGFTMDSEIIVILDGAPADPPLPTDPRLTTITLAHSIGQRAATNLGARVSQARHVMKLDAHCRVRAGFDAALIGHCGPTDTLIPRMYNLQAFVWVCPACDYHIDQGPLPAKCERKGCLNTTGFTRDDVWDIKWGRRTDSMCFDADLKFKYWGEYPLREVLAAFHHATGECPTTYPPIMKMEWSAYQQLADAEKLPHRLAALMLLAQVYNDWKRTDSKRVLHQLETLADHEEVTESMSLLGAAWLMRRDRYWEIGGLDEMTGSWGQMGTEIACKTWLSGGRVLIDRSTWFAHLFRTREGFSWPYPMSNADQEHARAYSRQMWLGNKWPQQIYPLSWLIEKFSPVPTWNESSFAPVAEAGDVFFNAHPLAHTTDALAGFTDSRLTHGVTSPAKLEAGTEHVDRVRDGFDVSGVAASVVLADNVIEIKAARDGSDKESIRESVRLESAPSIVKPAVPSVIQLADPVPTPGAEIDVKTGGKAVKLSSREIGDREIIGGSHDSTSNVESGSGTGDASTSPVPNIILAEIPHVESKFPPVPRPPVAVAPVPPPPTLSLEIAALEARANSVADRIQPARDRAVAQPVLVGNRPVSIGAIYYTDNVIDPALANSVRRNLESTLATVRTKVDLICVSRGAPAPITAWPTLIVEGKRGVLTMFRQILAGLEASTAEVIFFAEHDVLYAPGYFDFRPPDPEKVWYNLNIWNLRLADGHCVYWDAKRTSQLCAYRTTLLDHYRARVARVEAEGRWSQAIGFEPGSHGRAERIDDLQSATWQAARPSVDIKHDRNLTPARWRQDQFRSPRSCRNWQESDSIPYWGNGRELAATLICDWDQVGQLGA